MKTIRAPMWDEGIHTVLYEISVSGKDGNISKIKNALERGVKFIADGKGDRSASAFMRKHFNDEVLKILR